MLAATFLYKNHIRITFLKLKTTQVRVNRNLVERRVKKFCEFASLVYRTIILWHNSAKRESALRISFASNIRTFS